MFEILACCELAGDGNCAYRAFGVGLVTATAGLDGRARKGFIQHVKDLNRALQQQQPLLGGRTPSGGSLKEGFDALLVSSAHMEPSPQGCFAIKLVVHQAHLMLCW